MRLGDFGLATRHRSSTSSHEDSGDVNSLIYDAIDDISGLLGGKASLGSTSKEKIAVSQSEGLTGGVGTTFYRAPEQEGLSRRKSENMYDTLADIFSLGIVMFELFHPPFDTVSRRERRYWQRRRRRREYMPPSSPCGLSHLSFDEMCTVHGKSRNVVKVERGCYQGRNYNT